MPQADTIRSVSDAAAQPWAKSRNYAWLLTWLTAILLLLTEAVFVWALGYSAETFRVVGQTRDFNLQMQQLLSQLRDAETGQRGFALTGSDVHLRPWTAALAGVDRQLEDLRRLTQVSPLQRDGVNEIATLAHAELAFIGETVKMYRERGPEAAQAQAMSPAGLAPMSRLRTLVAHIRAETEPLVWKRASIGWKNLVIGLLFGCGSILVCVCFSLVSMRLGRRRLSESEERFRQIADGIPALAWMTDPEGTVYWYNQRWFDYTGTTAAQMNSGPQPVHPDKVAAVMSLWKESISSGQLFEMEFPLRRADGVYRDFLTRTRPWKDKTGNVVGWFGTNTDITELTQTRNQLRQANESLEARIAERTAELVTANRELEAFAYSVSHDLRAPVRHMDGFAELLRKNCYGALDAQGKRYLDRITTAAQRMGRLIDDLLAFSRLLRTDLTRTQVSLHALQAEVRRELESDLSQRSVVWVVGDLPEVTGDHSLLRQVFVNLLSNAVKYTRGRPEARIEIGCAGSTADEATIFVRDNGAGFEMAYVHKLFEVFQRLHSNEFEGNGIGLATVRRIVERHGGRVWAEGEVDRGATFYCSLRLKKEKTHG